jgi:DNA-binding transcriptional LysR family regulator
VERVDWDDFRLFAAVARNGNFTRAARELKITEPTISRRLRRLEESLGTKLFNHTGADAHLTREGRRVLSHASAAEYAIAQAAKTSTEGHEPSLCKIVASDGVSTYWLPQFLPSFLERHPQIDVALFTTPDRYGPKPPLFDLRLQYTEAVSEDLVCIRLGTMHFTLFAAQSYVRAHGRPAQISELTRHRVLDLALDMSERGMLAAWARHMGRTALLTNMNGALCETVRYGGGIALLPTFAGLLDPHTVAVLPTFSLPVPLFLSFEREVGKRPAVRTTIDYLRDAVFDRRSMPWFADEYQPPAKAWGKIYQAALARSASPQPLQE